MNVIESLIMCRFNINVVIKEIFRVKLDVLRLDKIVFIFSDCFCCVIKFVGIIFGIMCEFSWYLFDIDCNFGDEINFRR